jgi:hypothetical protein
MALKRHQTAVANIRRAIDDNLLPRHIVTRQTLLKVNIPDEEHEQAWYLFQSNEILGKYLDSATESIGESLWPFIHRIRQHRVALKKSSISYFKSVAGGRLCIASMFFLIECKALTLEYRYRPLTSDKMRDWRKERGFLDGKLQSQFIYDLAILRRYWNRWVIPIDLVLTLLNHMEARVAHMLWIQESLETISRDRVLDGIYGIEISPSMTAGHVCASNRFINDVALVFLDLFASYYQCEQAFRELKLVDWSRNIVRDAKEWFPTMPPTFFDWFETQSKIIADSTFHDSVIKMAARQDLLPGEELVFESLNNGVSVLEASRIFQITRSLLEKDWWTRDALESFIHLGTLRSSGRTTVFVAVLVLLFDSVMNSRFKFKWGDACFFSESRFRENYYDVVSSQMPIIVQLRGAFYVHYHHSLYVCHTIERAIYLWMYILKEDHHFQFVTYLDRYNLTGALDIWVEWTGCVTFSNNVLDGEDSLTSGFREFL